jgi:hypothetical protein
MTVRDVGKVLHKASELRKMDRLVTSIQSVWHTAEGEGDLAEELHNVEQVKRICAVPCLKTLSVL